MNDSTTTVYAAVVDAAPPPRTPMPLKRDASTDEDAPQDVTPEDAAAAQRDADAAALTDHYVEDRILGAARERVERDFAGAQATPAKESTKPNKET